MFIAALFLIARIWKQPRCSSMEEWIKKVWHVYTLENFVIFKARHYYIGCMYVCVCAVCDMYMVWENCLHSVNNILNIY